MQDKAEHGDKIIWDHGNAPTDGCKGTPSTYPNQTVYSRELCSTKINDRGHADGKGGNGKGDGEPLMEIVISKGGGPPHASKCLKVAAVSPRFFLYNTEGSRITLHLR